MIDFYTYLHLKPDGTPFYVGKGFGRRSHVFANRSRHHKNIVSKLGGKDCVEVLVFPRASEKEAFEDEVNWIRELRMAGYELCNKTDGGDGISGFHHSDETRKKQSESAIGRKLSPETKLKISESQIGKKRSKTSCEKQAATMKGRTRANATIEKMKIAATGRTHSEETRKKLSLINKGKAVSEATKKKLSSAAKADWAKRKINHSAMTCE